MLELLTTARDHLEAGGAFIYPIHAILILALSIGLERIYVLFVRSSMNVESFIKQLKPVIQRKDLQSATQYCDSVGAPESLFAKSLIVKAISH